jgi:hypothetical protein
MMMRRLFSATALGAVLVAGTAVPAGAQPSTINSPPYPGAVKCGGPYLVGGDYTRLRVRGERASVTLSMTSYNPAGVSTSFRVYANPAESTGYPKNREQSSAGSVTYGRVTTASFAEFGASDVTTWQFDINFYAGAYIPSAGITVWSRRCW